VLLIVDQDTLHEVPGAPPADLDGWRPVSSATARMLCCDAEVTAIRIRLADGTVLNAGRIRRDPSPLQRDAVLARDRRCVGCGAPARRCHIHHIRWVRHEALIRREGCKDPPPSCRSRAVKLEAA
jgi:NAD-dependent dihydropyrimidine dehydrogenase PreA subunit